MRHCVVCGQLFPFQKNRHRAVTCGPYCEWVRNEDRLDLDKTEEHWEERKRTYEAFDWDWPE